MTDIERDPNICPECGKPSELPLAEVYCVECATEGWQDDAIAHLRHRWRETMSSPSPSSTSTAPASCCSSDSTRVGDEPRRTLHQHARLRILLAPMH